MSKQAPAEIGLFAPQILKPVLVESVRKLDPRGLIRHPVIFTTALVSPAPDGTAPDVDLQGGLAGVRELECQFPQQRRAVGGNHI